MLTYADGYDYNHQVAPLLYTLLLCGLQTYTICGHVLRPLLYVQVDFLEVWQQVVEAFQQVCDAFPDIKVSRVFDASEENTRFFACFTCFT